MIKRVFHDITNINKKNIKLTIHKSSHRRKLLMWLYEVVNDFEYSQATFGLTISILDVNTQRIHFKIIDYQLIGITSLFIAAKIEERKQKSIVDYIQVTDNLVSKDEILEMEKKLCENLSFLVNTPHSYLTTWYLQNMSSQFSLLEKREILFAAIAYVMGKDKYTKNPYSVYLDGIREAEKILTCSSIARELQFYLVNNKLISHLFFDKPVNK